MSSEKQKRRKEEEVREMRQQGKARDNKHKEKSHHGPRPAEVRVASGQQLAATQN